MLRNLIRWARIVEAGKNGLNYFVQKLEYRGKVAEGVIVFPYGMHGNIPANSLAVMFAIGGDPDNRAAIGFDHKNRPDLESGEVAFYHPGTMAWLIWRASGDLDITTGNEGSGNINIICKNANVQAEESVTIDTPSTLITGNLTVAEDLIVAGNFNLDGNASLGSGGQPIARVGDAVSGGAVITGGSANHTAT